MAARIFQSAFETYRGGAQLGQGGTGFVMKATAASGETVAIKVFRPSHARHSSDARFRNEIRFGEQAGHKNVVRVLDHGAVDLDGAPAPFYVMPLYPQTLRHLMTPRIDHALALKAFQAMLDGVECAHLKSVIHRDLKPENVLASRAGEKIVIADFGAAQFSDSALYEAAKTKLADRLANHRYCAPEQAIPGQPVDQTADIYALGLMLNEMFTGEVMRGSSPTSIGSVAPAYAYLDALVDRMTKQKRSERIQSIATIKSELSDITRVHFARQRVDQLSSAVIQDDGPNDPTFRSPPRIIDRDWDREHLSFTFSAAPPPLWKQIFSINRVGMDMRSVPPAGSWTSGTTFIVRAAADNAQGVVTSYEQHVAMVNAEYARQMNIKHQEQMAAEAQARAAERRNAETRARVLQQIKR
jgi:serine/threonine protein kinase